MLAGWVALTGTPGVGKTTVARRLKAAGVDVVDLGRFVARHRLWEGTDRRRKSRLVDPLRVGRRLAREFSPRQLTVLEGHWSHDLPQVRHAVVLRLRPRTLESRLRRRGWAAEKARENAEAEAIGLVLQEAVARLGRRRTFEIDATRSTRGAVAASVMGTLRNPARARKKFEVGRVDWAADILRWY